MKISHLNEKICFVFFQGMDRTSGHNFGGGNTDWEETRLGSWADRSDEK